MAHRQTYHVEPAAHIRGNPSTIVSNTSRHPAKNWAIPTLDDTYELLMTYSTRIVHFLHRQMANGHRLPDPWDEACALEKAMSRTTHMFFCLWQSEGDPERFENIQEWASIVYEDAKTKMTAIEIFVRLERRRRQRRSGETDTPSPKARNPIPANPKTTHAEYTPAFNAVNTSKYQAKPDPHAKNKASSTYGPETTHRIDSKFDAYMQARTPQMDGQDKQLPHPPRSDFAERTRESSGTRYQPPTNYRDRSPERIEQPLRNRTNLSTPPTPHETNPGNYCAKTKAGLQRYHESSYANTRYIRSETRHTPPEIDTKHIHLYRERMEPISNSNAEQHLRDVALESRKTSGREDDEWGRNRAEGRRFSDTRNDHRKRRTATTKETMW